MDKLSWQMFFQIISENPKFVIVLLMQTDDLDRIKIREEHAPEFENIID